MFFSEKTDDIDYARSQGSTKLTVTGQFVQIDSAWVSQHCQPSRPQLTSSLLKKQARHQCDVCTPSSDCLVVYNQFVTPKKCMAATVSRFLRSRMENRNN